jgi:type II secretory pathway component GspD/PulD (secretin)
MNPRISKMNLLQFRCLIFAAIGLACLTHAPFSLAAKQPHVVGTHLISLSLKETNISELFEMLSRENNVNILLANGVEGTVSVNLYNVSVDEAIHSIAEAGGYAVERIKNGYLITPQDKAGKTIAEGLREVRTYKVQYSNIQKVSTILKNYLSRYGKIDVLEERKILVVEDLPEFIAHIERILYEMEREPAQILIEARIYSISLDNTQKFGIDWTKTFSAAGGKGNFGAENLGKQATNLAIGAAAGPPGLFFNYVNNNIEAQLNLLSQKGKARALATPKILALEHQQAQVIIGARVGYKLTTTINLVTSESIQFLESGVILEVTSFIDNFGRIMMDIHPQVSKASFRGKDAEIPSLQTTEVETRLLVDDGQTVFIGGLIDNSVSSSHQGVPFLEDIPFLGYLFSKEDDVTSNTETIVLIKPVIIRQNNRDLLTAPNSKIESYNDTTNKKSKKIDNYFKRNYMFRSE